MSEFLKIAAGRAHGFRESFRKLPRARRISLLLAGAALAALSVLPFTGGGRDPVPETSAAGALERGEAASAGTAARESDLEPAPPSLWETPRQVEERSREHNRRRVEQAIEENPRIARARLVLSRAQPARSALQRAAEDSAAVTLTLAPGVRQLDREEADSIRSIVECAFNVRPERVSMTDNFLRAYNEEPGLRSSSRLLEAQERCRLELKHCVEEHYARLFARDDFNVSAIVWLSAEQSSVEKILMDPDLSFTRPIQSRFEREEGVEPGANEGGLLAPPAPGVRRVVRETTEEKAFVSQSKTITNIPPGIVQGVSLTVLFDLEAVETVIARDARAESRHSRTGADPAGLSHALWQAPERSLAVLAFVAKEEEALRTLLRHPVGDAQVKVLVHPFAKRPAGEARDLPAPDIAAAGPPPGARTGAAGWILAALLAAAAIAGAALVLRRSVPGGASASNREPEGGWKALRREHAPGAGSLGEDVLRTVTRTNGAVRENPEAAAYVLRFWLSQDAAESLGGQTRS